MKSLAVKIIRLVLSSFLVGGLLWFINVNYPASGVLEVSATLGTDKPMISSLGPAVRLKKVDRGQLILESPVYFDVRANSWFRQVIVKIDYQSDSGRIIGVAGKVGPGWQYNLERPIAEYTDNNGNKQVTFIFDLDKLYRVKNVSRFLIEAEASVTNPVKITNLKAVLRR